MSEDEGFRRYMQTGMAWFSVTQQKAEAILRDLADSGETAMGQAQKAFERIVERSRQGSDELRELVRAEIRGQVAALGLATKDDIARLEAKLDVAHAAAEAPAPGPDRAAAAAPTPGPAPTATESAAPGDATGPAGDPGSPARPTAEKG